MTILYILPFKNGKYFKYGVTDTQKQGFARPHDTLNKLYDLDFVNAKMVTSTETRPVLILERQLKDDFSRYFKADDYIGSDGYSEILPIEHFDAVIAFIKAKISVMEWQSLTLGHLPMPETKIRAKMKKEQHVIRPATVRYIDSFDLLDVLAHPYGQILLAHIANDEEIFSLSEEEHPGIFKFVNAAMHKSFHYSLENVGGNRSSALRSIGFIQQVIFYFEDAKKAYLEIYLHREFRDELKTGFFDNYIKEHEPKSIDINLLDDVKQPSDEEIRRSELEDQRYQALLVLEVENLFS